MHLSGLAPGFARWGSKGPDEGVGGAATRSSHNCGVPGSEYSVETRVSSACRVRVQRLETRVSSTRVRVQRFGSPSIKYQGPSKAF
ncbi:hypothetical protein HOLleu_19581 [Holothuria leucospilota]|uniref:Uncharacterized protein n=1 Tax=Holothuria leucospilota TaxID=206669 RepID=A0A9Q1C025_HOLLE|nr:hypothetical protein HOLleu_19581 [Holothuria leucospilota]